MIEQLVSFETAKLAREKGFNEPTIHFYTPDGTCLSCEYLYSYYECEAPTQSLLQKWLRDIHKILVEVNYRNFSVKGAAGYFYVFGTKGPLYSARTYVGETVWKGYNIYEEALEDALCQALKLIK